MTISTKAELRSALGGSSGLLRRAYTNAKLDEFILAGEGEINKALRLVDMVQTATGTLSTSVATLALPTRFQKAIQFQIDNPLTTLRYVPPSRIKEYVAANADSRMPRRFTVNSAFEFDAVPDSAYAYTLKYIRGYALSGDSETNYVLTYYPHCYLYAAAIHGAIHQRAWDLRDQMRREFRMQLASIKAAERERWGKDDATLETEFFQRDRYSIDEG